MLLRWNAAGWAWPMKNCCCWVACRLPKLNGIWVVWTVGDECLDDMRGPKVSGAC